MMRVAIIALFSVSQCEALHAVKSVTSRRSSGKWCILGICMGNEADEQDPEYEDAQPQLDKTEKPKQEIKSAEPEPKLDLSQKEVQGPQCSCDFPCWLKHDGSECFTHCCGQDKELTKQQDLTKQQELTKQQQELTKQQQEQDLQAKMEKEAQREKDEEQAAARMKEADKPQEAVDSSTCSCNFPCWLAHDGSACMTHCCGESKAPKPELSKEGVTASQAEDLKAVDVQKEEAKIAETQAQYDDLKSNLAGLGEDLINHAKSNLPEDVQPMADDLHNKAKNTLQGLSDSLTSQARDKLEEARPLLDDVRQKLDDAKAALGSAMGVPAGVNPTMPA